MGESVPKCMRLDVVPLPVPGDVLAQTLEFIKGAGGSGKRDLSEKQAAELAVQVWRLGSRINRMKSDGSKVRPLEDSHARLINALAELEITIEDPTGKPFLDGWLEVEPISFEPPDGPAPDGSPDRWVKQTLKPIVRRHEELLSRAEIVVAVREQRQG